MQYEIEPNLRADEFIDVLVRSTLAERRPVDDRERIEVMLRNAGRMPGRVGRAVVV